MFRLLLETGRLERQLGRLLALKALQDLLSRLIPAPIPTTVGNKNKYNNDMVSSVLL